MSKIRLKYVDRFTDRHGSVRYYFRRGKGARVPLPGLPGSSEFMAAYQSAADGIEPPKAKPQRGEPGTFDRLISDYLVSSDFARMKQTTQQHYRATLERWILMEKIGHRSVSGMRREHIKIMLAKRADTPGAANDLLKKMRVLIRFSIDAGYRPDDPTLRIKRFASGEHHTWTEDEIATYEKKWPIGTRERTAFSLLLNTGQRSSDVVKMARTDIDDNVIQVSQQKTGSQVLQKTGSKVWIPIHQNLKLALDAAEKNHIVILTTTRGKPFTAKGFGEWMAKNIDNAGLPNRCVPHGLRKAAARRLAEAGCSAHEIQSITGHKSLKEVERYTREVEQKRLAKAAMLKVSEQG